MVGPASRLRLLTLSCVLIGVFNSPASAQVSMNSFGDDLALLFCSHVLTNDSNAFRNKLREHRLRIRDIYPRIRCNGQTMIQFAEQHGSTEIGLLIVHSVLHADLHQAGDLSWAQKLPYNHPINSVLRERFESTAPQQ